MEQRIKSLLTPEEACALLPNVNVKQLHRLHHQGRIERTKYGKKTTRFTIESVLALKAELEAREGRCLS